ncbi:coatomer gamma subunit appendage domain protein [Teladorsagia circumcincta]|uniref:Coatomer gamma subunit appendage domain protein n=1 Tax=Teladorsagia circumcincta TaxID=45464 RepID=A0A2G9U0C5_TELCI|nr:coatomer gamma subunit appendage domain protein [Teladorsagia circumcincta]
MVVYEAASAIVALPNTTPAELAPAISVLQLFCSSPKAALRFAAVRTLNKVSMKHTNAVMSCNVDLEKLITDPNRSIATLAITTLLKTGAESSVERLMKQISSFVSEISDEFKIVVVDAIRSLCSRYPRKHAVMMPFLANMLRNDGGFEYKKAIVETIIAIVEENPDAKTAGLAHLCEFIEDCEHDSLATRVLHLLGREAPKTPNPSSYIRFIYNRVILESTKVRAAAVTALAKFGAQCAELRPSIQVLLKRCLLDSDDEVRDRATFYLALLADATAPIINTFVLDSLQVLPSSLERCLFEYVRGDSFNTPFDLRVVPVTSQPLSLPEKRAPVLADVPPEKPAAVKKEPYAEQLAQIPEFANLGPLFHSSPRVALTDDVTEYTVHAIKHIFTNHVVVQLDCKNTLNDQLLENVFVELEDGEGEWSVEHVIPIDNLPYNETKSTYVLLEFPESVMLIISLLCIVGLVASNTECILAVGKLICNRNQTRVLGAVVEIWEKDGPRHIKFLDNLLPDQKAGSTVVVNTDGFFKAAGTASSSVGCGWDYDWVGAVHLKSTGVLLIHQAQMQL